MTSPTETPQAEPPRHLADRTAWLVMLVPLALAVGSVLLMRATWTPAPLGDQWDEIWLWRDLPLTGLWPYLWNQHNEHRLVFPRLVFLADWRWFGARNILDFVVIGLTQLLGAALYWRLARPLGDALRILALALAFSLLASSLQWENLTWGFQVQFVGVYAIGSWALWSFVQATRDAPPQWGWMVLALALLVVATFNMANGVFAGAAMVATAMVSGRGRLATVIPLVATGILLAAYLHGYQAVASHSPPGFALQHPGRFLTYVAVYLGNVWSPTSPTPAAVMGALGALLTGAMALALIYERRPPAAKVTLFAIALFIGASAAMTALGRSSFGLEQALSSRYATPTTYFWAAQALFWTLTLGRGANQPARWTLAVLLALGLARLVQLRGHAEEAAHWGHTRASIGTSAVLGDIEDKDALKALFPDEARIHALVPYMRAQRIGMFAEPPIATVGAPMTQTMAPAGACVGAFDGLQPSPQPDGSWRAGGWGWDQAAGRPFRRLLFVDGGQVVGIGLSGLRRADVQKVIPQVTSPATGWQASLRRGQGAEVIAYGVTASGQACEIGRKAWPQ